MIKDKRFKALHRQWLGGVDIREFIVSIGDILLDENRVYGYTPQQYVGGDLIVDITGYDSTKVALVYFLDVVEPTINVTGGSPTVTTNGDFVEGVLNIIRISYNGTVLTVSFNNQL